MSERRTFPNSADVVARARGYVTEQLHDVPAEIVEIVGLMVSELATNCVRHTVSDFTVEVDQTARRIRVQVTDTGQGEPTIRSPLPTEPSGRGLRIVEDLADAFGVEHDPATEPPKKTVWFEVMLDQPASRPDESSAQAVSGLEVASSSSSFSSSPMLDADLGGSTPIGTEPPSLGDDEQPRASAWLNEARRSAAGSTAQRELSRLRCTSRTSSLDQWDSRDPSHFARSRYPSRKSRARIVTVRAIAARRGAGATCAPTAATRALD